MQTQKGANIHDDLQNIYIYIYIYIYKKKKKKKKKKKTNERKGSVYLQIYRYILGLMEN
jgi:hypothetical protein